MPYDFFIFFIHPANDGERRVGSRVVKPFKRGELGRLIFADVLRAVMAGDGLQQRSNQAHGQADLAAMRARIREIYFSADTTR